VELDALRNEAFLAILTRIKGSHEKLDTGSKERPHVDAATADDSVEVGNGLQQVRVNMGGEC